MLPIVWNLDSLGVAKYLARVYPLTDTCEC